MGITVKNLNGTSDRDCACGTWIQHWEKFSGTTAGICARSVCLNTATVGAHVKKSIGDDHAHYIAPMCHACNGKRDAIFNLRDDTRLIPANVAETCAKPSKPQTTRILWELLKRNRIP